MTFRRRRPAIDPSLHELHQRHPGFREAVLADFRLESRARGEVQPSSSRLDLLLRILRLIGQSDAFGALVLYRLKTTCLRTGSVRLARVAHRAAILWAQVSIGDPVLIHPGVRLPHGHVVIDGLVEIHSGAQIRPFVTIGLREGDYTGPTIHRDVQIGTGAKIIGPVTIGERARVGANAVVLDDVPAHAVVVGVPARVVERDA